MKTGTLVILAVLIMATTCEHEPPQEGVRQDKALAATLKKSQETITIDGKRVVLSAYLWRDFMPSIGERDNSMKATVKVTGANKIPLPENVMINRLIVVKGDSVWVTHIEDAQRLDQRMIQAGAKGGPEWEVGSYTDVIVEIDDGDSQYYLRKGEVRVEATH